jgi:type II secretion system protein J
MTKRNGFTLLELLTVLAVLSVVSTLGVTAFFKITDYWQVTTLRQQMHVNSEQAFGSMRDDFGNLLSYQLSGFALSGTARLEDEKRYGRVPLEDDAVVFPITYVNPLTEQREQRMVRYGIDRVGVVPRLVRHTGPLGSERPSDQEEVIAEGVLSMRCSYFDGAQWRSEWPAGPLPEAVRVSLVMQDPDRPYEQIARTQVFTLKVAS